eukprot:6475581-Pyramimonas_sp.AAC.1
MSGHPQTTQMHHMAEWDYMRNHAQLHWCIVHQCETNFREHLPPFPHLLKSTEFWASRYLLVRPFLNLKCNRRHHRATIFCCRSHGARLWTWELAKLVATGVRDPLRHLRLHQISPPADDEGSEDEQ